MTMPQPLTPYGAMLKVAPVLRPELQMPKGSTIYFVKSGMIRDCIKERCFFEMQYTQYDEKT